MPIMVSCWWLVMMSSTKIYNRTVRIQIHRKTKKIHLVEAPRAHTQQNSIAWCRVRETRLSTVTLSRATASRHSSLLHRLRVPSWLRSLSLPALIIYRTALRISLFCIERDTERRTKQLVGEQRESVEPRIASKGVEWGLQ